MTSPADPISSIAIFGRSEALWPVAALLGAQLPERVRLILVEESDPQANAEAVAIPVNCRFLAAVGLDAETIVGQCNGTLGLAVELRDWRGADSNLLVAPSGDLPAIAGLPAHQIMLCAAMMAGEPEKLAYLMQPFRFAARAAMAGKFADVPEDPQSPLTLLGPMVQCDRAAYAALLASRFARTNVERHAGKPTSAGVAQDGLTIETIALDSGKELRADFLIDVSGSLSDILPDAFDAQFESLPGWSRFSRSATARIATPRIADQGYPVAHAFEGGLLIETPMGEGAIRHMLFDGDRLTEARLVELLGEGAKARPYTPGVAQRPWIGNVVRLGAASACFGPCFSADMRFTHEQALQLARLIPAKLSMQAEAERFNSEHHLVAAQIRDFLTLPLALNSRSDAPWRDFRDLLLPESLAIRLGQFRSRGRFVAFDHELFDRQSWIELMIGMGVVPDRCDARVGAIDMQQLRRVLKAMAQGFTDTIAAMADRDDYLQQRAVDR